jgi:hypothetical protein
MSDDTKDIKTQLRDAQSKIKVAEAAVADAKNGRIKALVWAGIGGALLVAVGGQWLPGYQLDSTAKETSSVAAAGAVRDVMAQLCAERFMRQPGLDARIVALKAENGDWSQANYIRDGDWAVTPDGAKSDHSTADQCRALIAERASKGTG